MPARDSEAIDDALHAANTEAVPLLDKHLDVLTAIRKEREDESTEDVDQYGRSNHTPRAALP